MQNNFSYQKQCKIQSSITGLRIFFRKEIMMYTNYDIFVVLVFENINDAIFKKLRLNE